MTIQIKQEFPHCARCGIMVHTKRRRIAAKDTANRPVVFCSDLCRDEHATLFGLADRGEWRATGETGGIRQVVTR